MLCATYGKMLLDLIATRNQTITFGTAIYAGLATNATTPAFDGTGITEPSGNNYARVLIGYYNQSQTQKLAAAYNDDVNHVAKSKNTGATIFFPKATGAWGVCTHLVIFTALTGGSAIAYGALASSISPVSGDVPIIEPDGLELSIA